MAFWLGLPAGGIFVAVGRHRLSGDRRSFATDFDARPGAGTAFGGSGDSGAPIISPDGHYVLFASVANNLAVNSNSLPLPILIPPKLNVFLRDRTNQTTTLVSVNLAGAGGGNGDSLPTGLSDDGRYALFESSASDLVPGDTNKATDIFVRDLVNDVTLLVSVSTNGGFANGASRSSVMTPDGRYVAFVSAANNLVPRDTNRITDIFVRNLQAGVTVLVSAGAMSTNPTWPTGGSEAPDITPDGRYVAFSSTATNLVPGVRAVGDIYVRDLVIGTTVWASAAARTALQAVGRTTNAVCYNHAISADGQFVAYEASQAPNSGWSSAGVVLRYNVGAGLTDLVHTNAAVAMTAFEDYRSLDITPDGRFIAFVANTNSTSGTTTCVCLWDAQTGAATLASGDVSNAVPAGSTCYWPTLDASGRSVAFASSATNLVTNTIVGDYHLYVRDTQAATTTLADADTNGIGSGVPSSSVPRLSADGRCVAFECLDAGLVTNDRNHDYDMFVRDLVAGTTELVSAHNATLPSLTPNGPSLLSLSSLSADGRYVAFASEADNLVANDTDGFRDVFVRDLLNGTNLLVSVSTNGTSSGDGTSTDVAISCNGRYVAFSSRADNLVAGDTNKAQDVFLRDLQTATTVLVSIKTGGGGPANGDSYTPMMNADGKYVLFRSKAANLAPGSFSGTDNLFLYDLQSSVTYALTKTGAGASAMTPDGRFVAYGGPSALAYVWDSQAAKTNYAITFSGTNSGAGISPDGNRIVYAFSGQLYAVDRSANTNWLIGPVASGCHAGLRFSGDGRFLVYAAPVNTTNQVYLYDFLTGINLMVSRNYTSGAAASGVSDSPDITSDGRFVAYRSAAGDIVPGDGNSVPDVFLYDRLSGATTLLSVNRFGNGAGDNRSLAPVFSADAQTLIFESWASDLVGQDFNHCGDLFGYSLYASGQIPLFSASIVPGTGASPGPWIVWPTVGGKTYRVQFKNSLDDADWQDFIGGVTILGGQGCLNDLSAGGGTRFYRVVAY